MSAVNIITHELLEEIKKHYRLDWYGTHGIIHWSRVYENGVRLSEQEGVNLKIVQLFSLFHDSQRRRENRDENHGNRGAQLALRLRDYCQIDDEEFAILVHACAFHTTARNHEDVTIQVCFDADRLDLGRVGTKPDPRYLCTPLAKEKEIIEWGYRKSLIHKLPSLPFGLSLIK